MNREQLQKVRDALEGVVVARHPASCIEALAILDAAIAAPEPRPFCYHDGVNVVDPEFANDCDVFPLYTHLMPEPAAQHARDAVAWTPETGYVFADAKNTSNAPAPQQREWQELSPLEMQDTLRNCAASTFDKLAPNWYEVRQFARAIEAALRTKNTGER